MSSADAVTLTGVRHSYDGVEALGPIDLAVPAGELLVLVGASGCGKTTLLRLIGGLERPTEGTVRTEGVAGIVFQQPRLFPWRTVGGNVALALRYAGLPTDRAGELLASVGLPDVANRRTWQLSGGQQQRVAIARALARPSPLLLLDEPFAALDALTRERLQEDLRRLCTASGRTCVFVTHSVDEAVFLGSRVVVLTDRPGRVALDLPIDLPRTGVAPDELRGLPAFAALRSRIDHALRPTTGSHA